MFNALRILCFFVSFFASLGNAEREAPIIFAGRGRGGLSVNYAEIRSRVASGFLEKANEMAEAVAVFQDLSKATVILSEQIVQHCSK